MPNARETLKAVEHWLGWNEETLSFGLRNAFDGLRLYDYAQANPDLPEMADEWEPLDRIKAIGYDPLGEPSHEAATSGASQAEKALVEARKLLDSVSFVAKEGDTRKPLKLINAVVA